MKFSRDLIGTTIRVPKPTQSDLVKDMHAKMARVNVFRALGEFCAFHTNNGLAIVLSKCAENTLVETWAISNDVHNGIISERHLPVPFPHVGDDADAWLRTIECIAGTAVVEDVVNILTVSFPDETTIFEYLLAAMAVEGIYSIAIESRLNELFQPCIVNGDRDSHPKTREYFRFLNHVYQNSHANRTLLPKFLILMGDEQASAREQLEAAQIVRAAQAALPRFEYPTDNRI